MVIEIQMRRQESAYSRFTDAAAKIVGIIFQLLDPRYGADIFAKRFALNERVQLFERRWKALRLSIGVVRANLSAVFNTEAIVSFVLNRELTVDRVKEITLKKVVDD